MVSLSNVLRMFRERGMRRGFEHVTTSAATLIIFVFEKFSRKISKVLRLRRKNTDKYLTMQKSEYNLMAKRWSPKNRDPVVGWWDEHNAFPDYDRFLFRGLNTENLEALEYGCGPGRNIQRFAPRFKRIDGVDISAVNIRKAKKFLTSLGIKSPRLWSNDGIRIDKNNAYDVVFSVITLQHIASYQVRFAILEQMFGALRPGGTLSFQMGFGTRVDSVHYLDNFYGADSTNGGSDVRVDDKDQIYGDIKKIGFVDIQHEMGPVCHDLHEKWIWVMAKKPGL